MTDMLASRLEALTDRLHDFMENVERRVHGGDAASLIRFIPGPPQALIDDARILDRDLTANGYPSPLLSEWSTDPGEDITPQLIGELRAIRKMLKTES